MLSYQTLNDFVYSSLGENIGDYIKSDFIEYELFLKCYNKYRFNQGLKTSTTLNKFNWFCNKLNMDKENLEDFKRGYNNEKRNVFWINKDIISKLYPEVEEIIIN